MPMEVDPNCTLDVRHGEVVVKPEITPFLAAASSAWRNEVVGTPTCCSAIPAYLEFFGFRTTTPEELRQIAWKSAAGSAS